VKQSYAGYVVECTKNMLGSLRSTVESGQKEVEIGQLMTGLTADIISRIEFGSSYEKGKRIFHLLTLLQQRCAQASKHLCLPGSRLVLPSSLLCFSFINRPYMRLSHFF